MPVAFLASLLESLGSYGDLNEKCLPQSWALELLLLGWFRWCSLVGGSLSLGHLKLCGFSFLLFPPPLLLTAMVPHHDGAMVLHQDGAMFLHHDGVLFPNQDGGMVPHQDGVMVSQHDGPMVPHQDGAMVPHCDRFPSLWNHKPK